MWGGEKGKNGVQQVNPSKMQSDVKDFMKIDQLKKK
jgi:hypothetical protein